MIKINYFEGHYYFNEVSFLRAANRAFLYGDSVFESIALFNGQAPLLSSHFERLEAACAYTGMVLPPHFTKKYLQNICSNLAGYLLPHKDTQNRNARLRISVWRAEGGRYTPQNNQIQYLIEAEPLPNNGFVLNRKGLQIGICPYKHAAEHSFGGFKTGSALQYVRAALYKQAQGWDDCILTASDTQWLETTTCNLFVLTRDNRLLTPPATACVRGVMRRQLLLWAKTESKLSIIEQPIYCLPHQQDLAHLNTNNASILSPADISEIWCTNAVQGVHWVGEWQGHQLACNWAKKAVDSLNSFSF